MLSQRHLEPSLGFEPSSAPYRGAASPQCFEGKWCWHGESNARHSSLEGGDLSLTNVVKSFAETRALGPERPTGRRGALCTRAPSWTFTSFDPCGSEFMPASKRAADDATRAARPQAATRMVTLRSRFGPLACWRSCGPSGPPLVAEANGLRGLFWS